jgi:hypothetical protein
LRPTKKLPITSTSIFVRRKTVERFFRAADDWFVFVEGSVEHKRPAREFSETGY